MACNFQTADRRAKRSEFWDSRVVVIFIWGTFDLLLPKVINLSQNEL